jgi:hypothetical protein
VIRDDLAGERIAVGKSFGGLQRSSITRSVNHFTTDMSTVTLFPRLSNIERCWIRDRVILLTEPMNGGWDDDR